MIAMEAANEYHKLSADWWRHPDGVGALNYAGSRVRDTPHPIFGD